MAIATWKTKTFQISNTEVQAIKSMTVADSYNDSFNEKGKREGFEPVTLSITLDIVSSVLSGKKTARQEMDSWRSLVGQSGYFYLEGQKLISLQFKLLNVNSSNFVLGNSGELLSVSVQLDFQQAQTSAQAKAAAKAAKSGAAGSSSARSQSAVVSWGTYDGGEMTWAVPGHKTISSDYGPRTSSANKREVHSGIDVPAPIGTSIVAGAPGTVILAGYNGKYGKCVIIDHGSKIYTLYGHMNSIIVKKGQKVSVGQKIGSVGNTGTSTQPHLHFEVRKGGSGSSKHTNPWNYLSR